MKNNLKFIYLVIGFFIILSIASGSMFVVNQTQMALITQFGEPVKQYNTPGLKFKIPLIQNVILFDKRIQNLNSDTTEVIAADQKNMRVDSFAKYKIINSLKFYQTMHNEAKLKTRLSPILDSSIRQVLGGVPFKKLLSPERAELMKKITNLVNTAAQTFGVEIVDVRITRADLPDKSREAVYKRMRAEREKEAKEIRAQGDEHAEIIKAKADREKQIILAEAKRQADILRGEGEAEAIKTFGNAFGKDPQFYEFYHTMEAYKTAIHKNNTKAILTPNSDFMKYFSKTN